VRARGIIEAYDIETGQLSYLEMLDALASDDIRERMQLARASCNLPEDILLALSKDDSWQVIDQLCQRVHRCLKK
jgi:hypothetical protein